MNFRKFLFGLLAACVAAGAGYVYFERKHTAEIQAERLEAAKPIAAPSITVSKIATENFVETAAVSGSLVPREEILVSPEVEGLRVLELLADEGDTVKKGQVLARLVAEQLDAQLAQNDANLARATAAIAQAESQIVQAEAQAKEAAAQFQRAEPLKQSGYLSGSTYDQRESAAHTTAAQLIASRDALTAAKADKAQVEAQRRELMWRRNNTDVTSPEDGVISRRTARIGGMAATAGEPMFRVIENGQIELDAEIVETELKNVKVGQKAVVTVPQIGDFEGKVRLVSPEVDKATRLGRVKIFLGVNPVLRIGSYARGRNRNSNEPRPRRSPPRPSRSTRGSPRSRSSRTTRCKSTWSRSASLPAILSRSKRAPTKAISSSRGPGHFFATAMSCVPSFQNQN